MVNKAEPATMLPLLTTPVDYDMFSDEFFNEIQSVLNTHDALLSANNHNKSSRTASAHANIYEQVIAEAIGFFNNQDTKGLCCDFFDRNCTENVVTIFGRCDDPTPSNIYQDPNDGTALRYAAGLQDAMVIESHQVKELAMLIQLIFHKIPDAVISPMSGIKLMSNANNKFQRVFVKMSISGSTIHLVPLSLLNHQLPNIGKNLLTQYEGLLTKQNSFVNLKITPPQLMDMPVSVSTRLSLDGFLVVDFDENDKIFRIEVRWS